MNNSVISFENVSFSYDDDSGKVLDDFSIKLPAQGIICLTGLSGSGKTTLLRLMAGLEKPSLGFIKGLENKTVSMVFQEDRLLPWLNILDNVAIVFNDNQSKTIATSLLEDVGLGKELKKYPESLSGGMKRRVAIARALAFDADILLLDEPFNGLDSEVAEKVAHLIKQKYHNKQNRLAVLVTHQNQQAQMLGAEIFEVFK